MPSLSQSLQTLTTENSLLNVKTSTTAHTETQKPKSSTEHEYVTDKQLGTSTAEEATSETPSLPEPPTKPKDGVNGFISTVTTMYEVTVYKYDELVKKLIWISVMTVIAIAMVFVIMFVVFFNCYGVSKVENRTRPTSTSASKVYGNNNNSKMAILQFTHFTKYTPQISHT